MSKLNVTPGEVKSIECCNNNGEYYKVAVFNGESVCNITTRDKNRAKGNSLLIADSINTYNKCGLTPSELLQQNEEFKEALTDLLYEYSSLELSSTPKIEEVQKLLTKHTKPENHKP